MKKKSKTNIIILIALVILFILSSLIINYNLTFSEGNGDNYSEYYDNVNLDYESLRLSKISGKIHIINNTGWVNFREDGNCTGSGTYYDPYIIEDLVIDGGGSGNCIWIENSNVYFKIENCILYNSTAGILFSNVNSSLLINNNCSSNYRGIDLIDSNNNEISGNTANNNHWYGIHLVDSNNNEISGNFINNNYPYGIRLIDSNNNIILRNFLINNSNVGIDLVNSNNSKISENTVNNGYFGIYLWDCNNNEISGNIVNNNHYGIYLLDCNNHTLSGNGMNKCGLIIDGSFKELGSHDIDSTNLVNGKPLYYYINEIKLQPEDFTNAGQIVLVNCTDSLISNINTSYCDIGITLFYCNYNEIMGNTVNNNDWGIYLRVSNNNEISGNTVNNNYYWGIYLCDSNNNTISGNTINNNRLIGIDLYNCVGNIIYLNCFNNTLNAVDDGLDNHWDNGYKGNYWADYTGLDSDGNGIGDIPYDIAGPAGSQDNFPLMKCPLPLIRTVRIPFELIILISSISGGALIGIATLLLIRRKRRRTK